MQYHLPYIHGESWICRFIQQPHFQLFSLSLPAAAPFWKHHRTKYRIQDGKQPIVSGGKPLPSQGGTRQRLFCMSVLRFILCDGSYSFPDQPGFFPDEPRGKCFKPFTARLFQRSDIFHPLRQHPYCQKASSFHLFQNGNQEPEANSGTHSFLRQIIFALILFNHEKGSPLILQTPFFVPLFTLAFLLALPGFLFFRS